MSDSYIVLRNKTFHYRRRVPSDIQVEVGCKWWKRSLKTSLQRAAEAKAREVAVEHDQLIARLRGSPVPERRRRALATIDRAKDDYLAATGQAAGHIARARAVGSLLAQDGAAEQHLRDGEAAYEAAKAALAARDREAAKLQDAATVADKLRRVMVAAAEQRLDTLPETEREAVRRLGGVEMLLRQAEGAAVDLESRRNDLEMATAIGKVTPVDADERQALIDVRSRRLAQQIGTLRKLGLATDDEHDWQDPANPRINSGIEIWFAERKQGLYAVKRHRTAIRRFVELHGNVTVREITKAMVRDYVKKVETLPDNRRLPAKLRGGLQEADADVPRIAAVTVARHLDTLKAFLTFGVEQDWLTINVATGLRAPRDTRPKAASRRPFTRDELRKLMEHAVSELGPDADMSWLIRLGAYTGARLEELGQLARTNVREIEGVWGIDVDDLDGRNVKAAASVKFIPLHPAIRDDFLRWVLAGRGDRVFASFKRCKDSQRFANKLSGDFGRLMDRAGLTDPRLVFHSLRHTLKREMSNARVDPDVRRVVLGHAGKSAHDGYAGHSLSAIADELARVPAVF